jgi:hypothetical protein
MENINPSTNQTIPITESSEEKAWFLRQLTTKAFFSQFKDAIHNLEQTQPNWYWATIKKIELAAVKQLRDLLENKEYWEALPDPKPFVSWYHPASTIALTIPWEYVQNKTPKEQIKEIRTELTPTEQKKILDDLLPHLVLQTLSGGVCFTRNEIIDDDGNCSLQLIPQFLPFIKEILDQWPNQQEDVIKELEKPLYLYEDSTPKDVTKGTDTKIPGMWFQCNIGEDCLAGYLIIEIHPFMMDIDNKQAFHPITAKIIIASINRQDGTKYKPEPHYWPKEWRNAFWENLISHLEENLKKLENQIPTTSTLKLPPIAEPQTKSSHTKQILFDKLPQYTFSEFRDMQTAITDGKGCFYWQALENGKALIHKRPNQQNQIKITSRNTLTPDQQNFILQDLWATVQTFEPETADLLKVVVALGLEQQRATYNLDYLIKEIGWNPRSSNERNQLRQKLWNWFLSLDVMTPTGFRPGNYKDPITGKMQNVAFTDSFIKIIYREEIDNQARNLYDPFPPQKVTWVVGNELDRFRGNNKILPSFGDLRKITGISPGKPSAAWARSIGAALNQFWQEQGKQQKNFTRFQLLNLFRCDPWVEDILNSDNPKRAKDYWEAAITMLKNNDYKTIGEYKEIDPLSHIRKQWKRFWLKEQRLHIRPVEKNLK